MSRPPDTRSRCRNATCLHLLSDHDQEFCRKCGSAHRTGFSSMADAFEARRDEIRSGNEAPYVPLEETPRRRKRTG